jgi:threonyl-tRNA synthetase
MPNQVKDEFKKVIDLVLYTFSSLGFTDYTAQISLRDQVDHTKYIGSDENWERAEKDIQEAVEEKGLKNVVIEYGEAAFYGPKLDFMVRDAIGRKWQLGTIQVDYNLPERFELTYIGEDNAKHRPVMIHRAPFGSLERFVAVLTEHCAGKFPMWLVPVQVKVLPISDKFMPYAENVLNQLKNNDIRAEIDDRSEKIGKKIRDTELAKVPLMLIIGEKEVNEELVSVRRQGKGDEGSKTLAEVMKNIKEEVDNKTAFNPEVTSK